MPDLNQLCRVPGCNAVCPPGSDLCSYHREIFDEDVNPSIGPIAIHRAMEFLKSHQYGPTGLLKYCNMCGERTYHGMNEDDEWVCGVCGLGENDIANTSFSEIDEAAQTQNPEALDEIRQKLRQSKEV